MGWKKKKKGGTKRIRRQAQRSNNANSMTQLHNRNHRSLGGVSPGARDAFYWLVIRLQNPVERGGIGVSITLQYSATTRINNRF